MSDKTFFPQEITIENVDTAVMSDFKNIKLKDENIPVVWIESERYGEFKKSWYLKDDNGETMIPVIIISRMPGNVGHWEYSNIPNKTFVYRTNVRRTYQGVEFDKYSIKEPVHVKFIYELRFQSYKMYQQNIFVDYILRKFAAKQSYIKINEQMCSMVIDGNMSDESKFDDALGEKFYQTIVPIAVNAHLLNKDDFKKEKLSWRFTINTGIM